MAFRPIIHDELTVTFETLLERQLKGERMSETMDAIYEKNGITPSSLPNFRGGCSIETNAMDAVMFIIPSTIPTKIQDILKLVKDINFRYVDLRVNGISTRMDKWESYNSTDTTKVYGFIRMYVYYTPFARPDVMDLMERVFLTHAKRLKR